MNDSLIFKVCVWTVFFPSLTETNSLRCISLLVLHPWAFWLVTDGACPDSLPQTTNKSSSCNIVTHIITDIEILIPYTILYWEKVMTLQNYLVLRYCPTLLLLPTIFIPAQMSRDDIVNRISLKTIDRLQSTGIRCFQCDWPKICAESGRNMSIHYKLMWLPKNIYCFWNSDVTYGAMTSYPGGWSHHNRVRYRLCISHASAPQMKHWCRTVHF